MGFAAASCPWRIEYEGALYHVFSRGNNQQNIFLTDDDRYLFLDTIGQMSERYEINFTKYFYEFKPLRSLAEIKADILALEASSLELEKTVLED